MIGEFDDGLLSSAESDVVRNRRHPLDGGVEEEDEPIRAQVRHIGPPPPKARDKSAPPLGNRRGGGGGVGGGSRMVLNNQIDDIFSELTNEIYVEDKRAAAIAKIGQWKDRESPSLPIGQAPLLTRHVNDPLPAPPATDRE